MKVLLVNGGPHKKGCTYTALSEMAISIQDIQGAIINKLQVLDLSYLLGVKVKD